MTNLLFAGECIQPQGLPHLFDLLLLRIALHHVVQGGHVQVEVVLEVLVVTARLQVRVTSDQPIGRNQLRQITAHANKFPINAWLPCQPHHCKLDYY